MSDAPDNLVLEILRAMRGDMARTNDTLSDVVQRLSRIELSLAGLRRDQGVDAERIAHFEVRFDRVDERLDRIERRLGLIEG